MTKRTGQMPWLNRWAFYIYYAPHLLLALLFLAMTFPCAIWDVIFSTSSGERLITHLANKLDAWGDEMRASVERLSR